MTETEVKSEQVEANTEAVVENTKIEEQEEQLQAAKFSQEQLERVVEERLARQRRAILKKYEGVDVEKYNSLVDAETERQKEEALARKEFDTVLKQTVEKKDASMKKLQDELHSIKVEGSLLSSASNRRAVKPEQVVNLLKSNVKLGDDGTVEVIDPSTGTPRYTDDGDLMTVDGYVQEFLNTNPHFVNSNSAGSGSQQSVKQNDASGKIDITKLDMNNPNDRAIYQKHREATGLAR